ncbi:hypothetical protein ACFFLM_24000 [Deinococcus oregonensis]|uniref:Bacterial transcriptional activator domain-containing protein n=1 Tax=Deinococcus oregonensis TaxID=1805970 RepID=A0ABV6B9C4_9DEIO
MKAALPHNAVLASVLAGNYREGLRVFAGLSESTPEDQRWAGLCALNLNDRGAARDHLAQAVMGGQQAARIELAALYRFAGEWQLAEAQLTALDWSALEPLDRALAHRERAQHLVWQGHLGAATTALEDAWLAASAPWPGAPLRGPIAQLQGTILAQRGDDLRAAERFAVAWRDGSPGRQPYALLSRALSLTYIGRFSEALRDLRTAQQGLKAVPLAQAFFHYVYGTFLRARGEWAQAETQFVQSAEAARSQGEVETEAYAELGRAALACGEGRLGDARRMLARARALAPDWKTQRLVELRTSALQALAGDQRALPALQEIALAFDARGLNREAGWAWLHQAEAARQFEHHALLDEALAQAMDKQHALGSGALMVELQALPKLNAYLAALPEDAYACGLISQGENLERVPQQIRLITLGDHAIELDGHRIRLDFAQAVEVLSYVLHHGERRLEQIQADLFPEKPHKTSKAYIHGVRRELATVIPGLSLPYNTRRKTYGVQLDGPQLDWDVRELQRAFNAPRETDLLDVLARCGQAFLPHATTEWARGERDELQRWIIRMGLELMDEWAGAGELGKCESLAYRLLAIEPLDMALNEYLLRAVYELHGARRAQTTFLDIQLKFESEVGECPASMKRLAHTLGLVA